MELSMRELKLVRRALQAATEAWPKEREPLLSIAARVSAEIWGRLGDAP